MLRGIDVDVNFGRGDFDFAGDGLDGRFSNDEARAGGDADDAEVAGLEEAGTVDGGHGRVVDDPSDGGGLEDVTGTVAGDGLELEAAADEDLRGVGEDLK